MAYTARDCGTRKPSEIITGRIIEALNRGIIPWRRPWEALEVMSVDGRPYRGVNRLLLSWAGYSDPRFITYNKCREIGGSVRKGEKGWPVILWNSRKVEMKQKDGHGSEITVSKEIPFMRYYYVFNVEQCEGISDRLKPIDRGMDEFHPIDEAQGIVENFEHRPSIKHGGNVACYNPVLDMVCMPVPANFHSSEDYYATIFHELVHSTGHESRLHRDLDNLFGSEKYSKEELIAEIGSAFLCAESRIESSELEENTVAYIQSWIRVLQNDPNMVIRAAGKAQSAVDYILGRHIVAAEPNYQDQAANIAA